MKQITTSIFSLLLFLMTLPLCQGQIGDPRFEKLETKLEDFSRQHSNLRQKIDISALGSVREIVSSIAQQTKINITIDPQINEPVVSNFTKVRVQDILLYLCRQYNLDLAFSGSIITVFRYQAPTPTPQNNAGEVAYNNYNSKLKLNLKNDTLGSVARRITQQSKVNVIPSKKAQGLIVNAYVEGLGIEEGLNLLAKSNDLRVIKTPEGAYYLALKEEEPTEEEIQNQKKTKPKFGGDLDYEFPNGLIVYSELDSTSGDKLVYVEAHNVPFLDIIKAVSIELEKEYFLFDEARGGNRGNNNSRTKNNTRNNTNNNQGGISMKLEGATYSEFLDYILEGTNLTYKIEEEIYLIGDREREGLRQTKVIQLQYRSANEMEQIIPEELSEGVFVEPFLELNAIILSGSAPNIQEVEDFIREVDKLVPVVMIDLIIVDVVRNRLTETGLEMGVGDAPVQDQATLAPGFDFTFGAGTINQLLGTLAGRGIVNLGRVVPNFYVSLKAVEEAGIVKTRSKPQLSTLNSHEASFNIGETRYYQEARTTVQGVQGTVTQQDITFQPVQANFSIAVTPFVSGDEQITLDVVVEQSDFLGEIQIGAPPAQVTRKFDSKIRVKNGEMIALGGLETVRKEHSARGIPGMARVPVLNFLGRKRNNRNDSELLIFIRPTVIY